jgi:hypothetical protein
MAATGAGRLVPGPLVDARLAVERFAQGALTGLSCYILANVADEMVVQRARQTLLGCKVKRAGVA